MRSHHGLGSSILCQLTMCLWIVLILFLRDVLPRNIRLIYLAFMHAYTTVGYTKTLLLDHLVNEADWLISRNYATSVAIIITSPAAAVAKYCDEYVCVCLFVCLSARIYPEPHARSLSIFVHVAYGRGSVFLRQGNKIPRERGSFGGFSSPLTMTLQHCSWDPYKNGWTDRDAVWHQWACPE